MDVLKRALSQIKSMWGNLNAGQRGVVWASAAGIILLIVWGAMSAGTGDSMVKIVGVEVSQEHRSQVLAKLAEKNQRHEIRNQEIYVPRQDADRVVLDMSGEGIYTDQMMWKFLESSDIMASKWDKEKRFQIALQRKLEMMIRSIDVIRNASVQVNPQSEGSQLGFANGGHASAAVQVELKAGRELTRENVMAIAGLVGHAVPGLDLDKVHIMDTHGRPYGVPRADSGAGLVSTIRDHEKQMEDSIQEKIVHIFPRARVVVRALAKTTTTNSKEKKYGKPVVREAEDRKRKEKSGAAYNTTGIKGEGAIEQGTPYAAGRGEIDESESRDYNVFDEKLIEQSDPAGSIDKITVAVYYPVEDDPKAIEQAKADEPKIKAMVKAAAGPQADEGSVTIMMVPTRKPEPLPEPGLRDSAIEWLGRSWSTVGLGLLALVALALVFFVVRSAIPKGAVEEVAELKRRIDEGATAVVGVPEGALGDEDVGRLKLGIREMVSRNPRGGAIILKRWMMGK